jgi:Holliday junction resolvase RusA-like endonuclease
MIEFFVPGIPRPGGSKKAFALRRRNGSLVTRPNGAPIINITEDCAKTKDWRRAVAAYAKRAYQGPLLDSALRLSVTFYMPRPKWHWGKHSLSPRAPAYPTVKPDRTKMLRSTEDALTGILWTDDTLVCAGEIGKRYAEPGKEGALIQVEPMEPERQELMGFALPRAER